jgi:hypothetical protein
MKLMRKVFEMRVLKQSSYGGQVKLKKISLKNALLKEKRVILALDIFLDIFWSKLFSKPYNSTWH